MLVLLFAALSAPALALPPDAAVPTQAEVDADVDEGVAHVMAGGKLKWTATWSGDLSGETGGSVLTVQRIMMNTSVAGAALTEDNKGQAPQQLVVSLRKAGTAWQLANVRLTLPDGTPCGIQRSMPTATITDESEDGFTATFAGTLGCGEDKAKTVTVAIAVDAAP